MHLVSDDSPRRDGVAVVIPARDAEPWIRAAVLSALDQSEANEVVVVEDGSCDRTPAIVAELALRDRRLICLRPQGAPLGPGAARNLGARVCRSRFLAFLDADDVFLPRAFVAALTELKNPRVDIVLSRISVLYLTPSEHPRSVEYDPSPVLAGDWLDVLCQGNIGIPICSVLVRREAFDRAGGFDETLAVGQDLALWLKLACFSTAAQAKGSQLAAIYRRHGRNRSNLNGVGPVEAGIGACLQAWRWSRSAGMGPHASTRLLRAAGLRQRQLVARAIRGEGGAALAALTAVSRQPSLVANIGFWAGLIGTRKSAL